MTIPKETKAKAVSLYASGEDLGRIEAAIGYVVGRKTVREWARRAGVPPRPSRRKGYAAETRARAVAMYVARKDIATISAATGADKSTILRWVRESGADPRTRTRLDIPKLWEVFVADGLTAAARAVGCTVSTAHYHIHGRAGVPARGPGGSP